jgi:hypothetical protein
MQLATYISSDVISSGVKAETAFGFAVNGKAFRILSDTLYQNKIGSIVREISSNAMDSHIAAGKGDLPFEIHLPDKFEPWFSVKDFGLGLSHESVMQVYTTFFQSTKDNSNDQVGAFGLGSKTPFAYTDAFTVTSIHDGVCRTYSAMVREDGTPAMALFAETETTEGNGVEVMIPVEVVDHDKFIFEVSNQLAFFKVKPAIKNFNLPGEFKFKDVTSDVAFSLPCNFEVRNNSTFHTITYIIQGGVGYPLHYPNLAQHIPADLMPFFDKIKQYGANIHFNIGEIEVTPSREGISYSAITISNIVDKFQLAQREYADTVIATMNGMPNDWERACFLNTSNEMVRSVIATIDKSYTFKILHRYAHFNVEDVCYMPDTLSITKDDGSVVSESVLTQIIKTNMYSLVNDKMRVERVQAQPYRGDTIPANSSQRFVVIDDSKAVISKLRYFVRSGHGSVLVFESNTKERISDAKIAEIEATLGGAKVVRVSTLPVPDRTYTTNSKGYKLPKLWVLNKKESTLPTSVRQWTAIYDNIADLDGGYYLDSDSAGCVADKYGTLVRDYNMMYHLGLIDLPVLAIREKDVEKIEGNSEWIPLAQGLAKLKADYLVSISKRIIRIAYNAARNSNKYYYSSELKAALRNNIDTLTDRNLKKLVRRFNCPSKTDTVDERFLKDIPGYQNAISVYSSLIVKHKEAIKDKYPLLNLVNDSYNTITCDAKVFEEHVMKYINAVT